MSLRIVEAVVIGTKEIFHYELFFSLTWRSSLQNFTQHYSQNDFFHNLTFERQPDLTSRATTHKPKHFSDKWLSHYSYAHCCSYSGNGLYTVYSQTDRQIAFCTFLL